MAENQISIRYVDSDQELGALRGIAADVGRILTPQEEILYVAMQNATSLSVRPDSVVATTNRLIFYRTHILGRVDFADLQWQDIRDVAMKQGTLSTEFSAETTDGRVETTRNLNKGQAMRLYGICQQVEQEWREKRRVREMEEARARSGGIYMPQPTPTTPAEDPVARLAKAKSMLDQGPISEAEYDTLKAKILSGM